MDSNVYLKLYINIYEHAHIYMVCLCVCGMPMCV